jgi:hypothetical protein
LKFWENFFKSLSLTALDSRARDLCRSERRSFSAAENCLKESRRSCSTFAVALSGLPGLRGGMPPTVGLKAALGLGTCSAAGLPSGAALPSALGWPSLLSSGLEGRVVSGFDAAASALRGSGVARFSVDGLTERGATLVADPGRASCEEMMAGSTGAPGTVGCPVGGRLAGGVYLLAPPLPNGGKSRRTPLYLRRCQY